MTARSVVTFNNKGGVGKTTLCCNVAANLGLERDQRVLLIDCDPQCNATQLILGPETSEALYWPEDEPPHKTILDVLQPIQDGDAGINENVEVVDAGTHRFGVDLLPGHPRMSIIEDMLSKHWGTVPAGDVGSLRVTHWCRALVRHLSDDYDFIFFDVGPSLGSLNRSVLLGGTHFITPMACDIYSLIGLRNIGEWIETWENRLQAGLDQCDAANGDALERFQIPEQARVPRFAGYTVQQYIAKSRGGKRRPTLAYEQILQEIPDVISEHLGAHKAEGLRDRDAKLGDVPHMYSLVPLAQSNSAPIMALSSSDGLVGSQYKQAEKYAKTIGAVASALEESTRSL